MSISGASASWTMKMRSPGMARIVSTSILRASVWKESRISPMFGMVGAPDDLPGVAMVADVAAPGERLVADAQAALRRPLAELAEIVGGAVDAAERSGETLEQTSIRSVPSSSIRSNLRSARSKARARCGSGIPSKSRKGWNSVISRP